MTIPSTTVHRLSVVRFQLGEFNAIVYTRDFAAKDDATATARGLVDEMIRLRGGAEFTLHDCVVIYDIDPAEAPVPDEHRPN